MPVPSTLQKNQCQGTLREPPESNRIRKVLEASWPHGPTPVLAFRSACLRIMHHLFFGVKLFFLVEGFFCSAVEHVI